LINSYNNLGGKQLVELQSKEEALLTPAIVDMTGRTVSDEELFGPILQVIRASSFDEAVKIANDTSYGLVAGLISDSEDEYKLFYNTVRAGVINWNMPTTGASSQAPFGGLGRSGNYRPSGYFAADYA